MIYGLIIGGGVVALLAWFAFAFAGRKDERRAPANENYDGGAARRLMPKVTLIRLMLLAAALGCAQGVSAQLAPGQSGMSTMRFIEGEAAMSALMRFGRCYAKDEPEKALRLLATEPTSIEERRTYIALFRRSNEKCLGDISSLSADVPLVRGAIAEGFYSGGISLPPELMQTVPTLAQVRDLSAAARCYAASHADEIRSLLSETKPGSRKEYEAITRIMPVFFECVPEGARFNFGATVIRFRLAEALLRTSGPAAPEERS